MKKLCILPVLLCALLLCIPAMAELKDLETPKVGFAVVAPENYAPTAALLEDGGQTVMNYYTGTPVTVLSLGADGTARVRVGDMDAWLEGTMKQSELRYGEEAARIVRRWDNWFSAEKGMPVFAEMDEAAEPIFLTDELETMLVAGISEDGWLHVMWPYGGNYDDRGFVRADDVVLSGLSPEVAWAVPALEGEATAEQIRERAVEETLAHAAELGLSEQEATRDALDAMTFDIRLSYSAETGKALWMVWIDRGECDNVSTCCFDAQGTLISVEHSNG